MSDITIPAAAIEAGANVLCNADNLVTMDEARALARAACLAMLEAWPGVDDYHEAANWPENILILPLTEKTDDKA